MASKTGPKNLIIAKKRDVHEAWDVRIGKAVVGRVVREPKLNSPKEKLFLFTSEREDMPKTFARTTMLGVREALIEGVSRDDYLRILENEGS